MQIRRVALQSHCLPALQAFYTNRLGIPLESKSHQQFTLCIGRSRLTFSLAPAAQRPFYHFAFTIPPNHFEAAKAWVRRHVAFITDADGREAFDFRNWNARAVYFRDPAGNIVELIARFDLDPLPEREFDARCLVEVSEIGLVVRDVAGFRQQVSQIFGVQVYRNTASAHFAALGDVHGLLIIAEEHRPWFPAGPAAQIFPLQLVVEAPRPGRLLRALTDDLPYEVISASRQATR